MDNKMMPMRKIIKIIVLRLMLIIDKSTVPSLHKLFESKSLTSMAKRSFRTIG